MWHLDKPRYANSFALRPQEGIGKEQAIEKKISKMKISMLKNNMVL
jgi:hypothetical protein